MSNQVKLLDGETPAQALVRVSKGGARGKNKFGARKTNGYDSAAESRYADRLQAMKQAGAILDWVEQVLIELDAGITWKVDFMIIGLDGRVRFVEVKGVRTRDFEMRMKLLKKHRPAIAARLEIVK